LADVISVDLDVEFWASALGAEVRASVDEWVARGWVEPDDAESPRRLTVQPNAWAELSVARNRHASQDELQVIAQHADVLCRLFGVSGGSVHVGSSTYVGQEGFRFTVTTAVAPSLFVSRWVHPAGSPPPHPDLVWIEQEATRNGRATWNMDAQLRRLGELRRGAEAVAAWVPCIRVDFDDHLSSFELVAPERIALSWRRDEGKFPTYSLDAATIAFDGARQEISLARLAPAEPLVKLGAKRFALLDDDAEAVLRHVRATSQLKTERGALPSLTDPSSVIPEGVSGDKIDLSQYGERVLGFVPVVRADHAYDIQSSGVRWFAEESGKGPFLSLTVRSADPSRAAVELQLESPEEAEALRRTLVEELKRPEPQAMTVRGVRVLPTPALLHALDVDLSVYQRQQANAAQATDAVREQAPSQPREVVVLDEEHGLEPRATDEGGAVPWAELTEVLAPGMSLKEHQRDGLSWLWRHFTRGSTGVLLADEMGLGKTLQIACFLALQARHAAPQQKPALVVAPVLLLENWARELEKFLRPEAFEPLVILHDAGLRRFKQPDGSLDTVALRSAAVVLTNYDTLDRHQKSLLKIDWRAVVLDESQNIKNPETCRSRAARGLKRDFAICSTGTPVENRLLDIWAHFDFLSPLDPLGTMPQFKERFETNGQPAPQLVAKALAYPSPSSPVLRRTKDEVLDLKPKTFERHLAPMTPEQMALERRVVSGEGSTLEVLGKLRSLYQHPWLLRSSLFGGSDIAAAPDLETICDASPKLRLCVELLARIQERGEKALVFSPWIKMQQLLDHVLRLRFGLRPRIVNGETNQRRQALQFIDEFSASPGFNVLILSPLAAGAGLNIVAANHVIHYGRWWNPAKEDQATDRAYRIGQELPVTVHYPILHHPGDPVGGFDVALHELVQRKRALARDFLSPDADVTTEDIHTVLRGTSDAEACA
jgi:hypothetical protein